MSSAPSRQWLSILTKLKEDMGRYDPVPVIEQLFKFIYQDLIVIDADGHIVFMTKKSEEWFGLPPGGALGRHFSDFYPDLGLLDVAKTGIPQFGRVQEIRGTKQFVFRLPILRNGEVIGAFGTKVFNDLKGIEKYFADMNEAPNRRANVFTFRCAPPPNGSIYTFADILGISQSITDTKEQAMRIALTDSTVLLIGETGVGKELFAHSIHSYSKRAGAPFVTINCPAIPTDLAESELFGYEKGSFTGSNSSGKKGKFEHASGGTIFLDEISAMPLALQAKLLRVIQEKEIYPLGSSESRKVDCRIIAATNANLPKQIEKGEFRADLYYRLTSAPITISPLRERREDIGFLAKSLLPNVNRKLSGDVQSISDGALHLMQNYSWPGNVRELISILEQSVFNACQNKQITSSHLPSCFNATMPDKSSDENDIRRALEDAERKASSVIEDAERKAISEALEKTKGNKKKAAEALGISRAWLYQKMGRLNMT